MRTYDLVLFGATGFTGKLVAEYLAKNASLRWAIAGRSREKLERIARELEAKVDVLVADADDDAALDALAPQTRVVATTVGPYAKYGKKLVSACVRHGTHYCDLTGEVAFIRWSIDNLHTKAERARTRIVHSCGFDSIPFDLGVFMLFEHARRKRLAWARSFVVASKGGFSGGTFASMLNQLDAMDRDPALRRLVANPYALDPDPNHDGPDDADQTGVRFDEPTARWTAPFVMAQVNTRVVRRSNALLDHAYGPNFRYSEAMSFPRGARGLAMASAVALGTGGIAAVTRSPPLRRFAGRFLPPPGTGPSPEKRASGFFRVRVAAETEDKKRLEGIVEGHGDPGYQETAKMLGESALCLAEPEEKLPERFGVLTPAAAMGTRLLERLRDAGMVFSCKDASP